MTNPSGEESGYKTAENLTALYKENWQYKGFSILPNGNEGHIFRLVTEPEYYSLRPTKIKEEEE